MHDIWEIKKRVFPEKEVTNNVKCCLKQDKDREESIVFCDMEPILETQL